MVGEGKVGDGLKEYVGKKCYIRLENNRKFTGEVKAIDDSDSNNILIHITDKFGLNVSFSKKEILEIKEEK